MNDDAEEMEYYDVICESTMMKLIRKVNEMMRDGWMPCGNVFVLHLGSGDWDHYQSMIKITLPSAPSPESES